MRSLMSVRCAWSSSRICFAVPSSRRSRELVAQGSFASRAEADGYADDLETLHRDPSRSDLARALELGPDLLDADLRTREVRNWLDTLGRRST